MLHPLGKYLVVEPIEETKTSTGVLVPENIVIETNAFKVVKILRPNKDSDLRSGMCVVIPSHMLEEATFSGNTYYLVMENHVIGFVSPSAEVD
tara:strand:- start:246 stop:524 length:279 start_codon:yes stop_codon:yes gene_type:complete